MEKLNAFQIQSLTLSGFKCFDTVQTFDFGELTMISGSNHTGKSSIADAIAFTITGTTFYGEGKIDRLYSEQNPDVEVRLTLSDADGVLHELVRKRKKDRVSISYDDYNLRQQDLAEMFGDRDVFLSIFNPLYFIEELGDEGKSILEKYLPFVDKETTMAGLSEYNQSLLQGMDILAPEAYIQRLRGEVRDLKDGIIAYEGQAALLMTQRKESAQALNLLKIRLDGLTQEIATLENKKWEGISLPSLQAEQDEIISRQNELLSDAPNPPETAEQEQTLRNLELALARTQAKDYESKYIGHIAETNAALQAAYTEHQKIMAVVSRAQPGSKCPICLTAMTEAHMATVKAEFAPQLREIISRGQGLKSQLADLQELDAKSKEVFLQNRQADSEKYTVQITQLREGLAKANVDYQSELTEHQTSLQGLKNRAQALGEQLVSGNLTHEEAERLATLLEEQRQVQADFAAQETIYKQQSDDTKDKIAEAEKQIKQKEALISAVADYSARRAELTFEKLSAGDVRFKLFEVLKTTGEVKDCFKFTYQGRDYKRLSRSERLLAGVSTAELMKQLTGRNYPIFIDDSESVVGIPRPTGQTMLSRVVSKAPLSVRPHGAQAQVSKAA